jgi:hypothetical protein
VTRICTLFFWSFAASTALIFFLMAWSVVRQPVSAEQGPVEIPSYAIAPADGPLANRGAGMILEELQ